ncbi:MAG: tetratricopeptide repeat protein [Succinivibrionaceae bacterium]|nr:tetratricopeptide repeat protein [Succinivibrionaceae bacterium]
MDILTDDHEREETVRKWWHENWKPIFLGIAIAILGLVGFKQYQAWQLSKAQELSYALFSAQSSLGRAGVNGIADAKKFVAEHEDIYGSLLSLDVAMVEAEAGRFEDAAQSVDLALQHGGKLLQSSALLTKGRILAQAGKHEEALGVLRQVDGGAYGPEIHEAIGDVLSLKGDLAAARDSYLAAINLTLERKLPVGASLQLKYDNCTREGDRPAMELVGDNGGQALP